ncbi:MAG: signal peptidase I [Spirochaetes bacterium]|nr:signal peptidase I [Spirochaetota bacterium]
MLELKKMIDWFIGECKDWRGNIRSLFEAAVIVILLSLTLIQNYMIPTGSMKPKLMPGDRLFANRFLYGTKIPFTDGFEGYRLPKIKYPNRGDIIIFRAPPSANYRCEGTKSLYPPSPAIQCVKEIVSILCLSPFASDPRILIANYIGEKITGERMTAMMGLLGLRTSDWDPKKEYVKRVLAVGGETIEVIRKKVYINGEPLNDKWGNNSYADRENVIQRPVPESEPRDNFGPIYVPKVGESIVFKRLAPQVSIFDTTTYSVTVNGKEAHYDVKKWFWVNHYERFAKGAAEYTYKVTEPFYFAMGDNRNESCDSRYWGLVHFPYIKGQPNLMYWPLERAILQRYIWIY